MLKFSGYSWLIRGPIRILKGLFDQSLFNKHIRNFWQWWRKFEGSRIVTRLIIITFKSLNGLDIHSIWTHSTPNEWDQTVDSERTPGGVFFWWGWTDTRTDILPEGSASCVQSFDDSLDCAIRMTYRISLRSSSLWEPRHPLLKVFNYVNTIVPDLFIGTEIRIVRDQLNFLYFTEVKFGSKVCFKNQLTTWH